MILEEQSQAPSVVSTPYWSPKVQMALFERIWDSPLRLEDKISASRVLIRHLPDSGGLYGVDMFVEYLRSDIYSRLRWPKTEGPLTQTELRFIKEYSKIPAITPYEKEIQEWLKIFENYQLP